MRRWNNKDSGGKTIERTTVQWENVLHFHCEKVKSDDVKYFDRDDNLKEITMDARTVQFILFWHNFPSFFSPLFYFHLQHTAPMYNEALPAK